MKSFASLIALLLLGTAGTAQAVGRCTVVVDNVHFYYSEPFAYPSDDVMDYRINDSAQARDFEAHVRANYPVSDDVRSTCSVYPEGSNPMRPEGETVIYQTTFHHVQTGYTPRGE